MVMKKTAVFVLLVLFISSFEMEGTQAVDVAFDCYDKCTKDCLGGDASRMDVCDRKCDITCDPGYAGQAGRF
ncbi:hypothetical protein MRB53_029291 [Persea americana]|uniref:Uncharacterized protein n=1 Tax=Persea americana TaxID=3435 RepID=A0ACC2KIE1_PERAE|nr:hypothetical protein MRB53_029291 [Persea americana]